MPRDRERDRRSRGRTRSRERRRSVSPDARDLLTQWAAASTTLQQQNAALVREMSDLFVAARRQPEKARIEVPRFDGTRSWAVFHAQFQSAATRSRRPEDQWGERLVQSLRGAASDLVMTLPAGRYMNYGSLCGLMQSHYDSPQRHAMAEAELEQRTKQGVEPLQDFGADVLRVARAAHPAWQDDVVQFVARKVFIGGQADPDVRRTVRLRLRQPATLADAVTAALHVQAVDAIQRPPGKRVKVCQLTCTGGSSESQRPCCSGTAVPTDTTTVADVDSRHAVVTQTDTAKDDPLKTLLQTLQGLVRQLATPSTGDTSSKRRRARSPYSSKCYECGGSGHYKRNCPELRSDGDWGRGLD